MKPGKYVIEARRLRSKELGAEWILAHRALGEAVVSEHQFRAQAEEVLAHWTKRHPKVALLKWFELRMRIVVRAEGDDAPAPLAEAPPPPPPLPAGPVLGGVKGAPSIADLVRAAEIAK